MKRIWNDARRWLPGMLVSLIIIFVLARAVDWQAAAIAFLTLDWRVLPAFILLYFASTGSRAAANRVLLENRPTWRQSFVALMQGYLLNNALPLRLGELGRAFLLGRTAGLGTFQALSAIVIERFYDLAVSAMLLMGTLPFVLGEAVPWARPLALTTLGLVAIGLLSLHLLARYRRRLQAWLGGFGSRLPIFERLVLPRLGSFFDGLSALTSLPRFALATFWMLTAWVFGAANYHVLLLGFAPGTELWKSLFGMGVSSLGIAIPSAPAALGVFEGAMIAALTLTGFSSGLALAYAVMLHLAHIVFSGVIGMAAFWREGQTLGGIYDRLAGAGRDGPGPGERDR
jgi:glycosyltransferase 2 family protein